MITIEIVFLTSLIEITGKRKNKLQVMDGCTVQKLLDTLSETYGLKFKKLVSGENPFIVILVNGRSIQRYGLQTKLAEGDSVLMGALMTGG